MIFREYKDKGFKTSLLGMGCMRFPVIDGKDDTIDLEKAEAIIDHAYKNGVNYFDTAYIYHGGNSEGFIGKVLSKYPRNTYNIVTKMPSFRIKEKEDVERIFYEQLANCGVDYFDFYLCHGVSDTSVDVFRSTEFNIIPFLEEMQKQGKIKYLGFSSHASCEILREFASLRKWDIAQIQLNYFDWEGQKAQEQYKILEELGIPVVVMEPVRGGRLASLDEESNAILKEVAPDRSIASWAFRYLMPLTNIQTILSGMTTMEQLEENLKTFSKYDPLSDTESAALDKALANFKSKFVVPCTACRYCSDCPMKFDIPTILKRYNNFSIALEERSKINNIKQIAELPGNKITECLNCGICADHCPQGIDIPGILQKISGLIEKYN